MSDRQFDRVREQVQVLTGERGGEGQTAIRRADLRAISTFKMQSRQVTAAPTLDDFNRLQADVAALYGMLAAISRA